jgi:hypothetical protein
MKLYDYDHVEMSREEFMQHMMNSYKAGESNKPCLEQEIKYYRTIIIIYTIGAILWILSSI